MRGLIGQNLSYCPDWEPWARALIDAAKVSRKPELKGGRIIWRIYSKGDPGDDAGVYTVRVPAGLTNIGTVSSPAKVLSISPGILPTEAKVELFGNCEQLNLTFPAGTDLTGTQVLRPGYDHSTTPETGPWTHKSLAMLRKLNPGVLRFMDFLRINGSELTTWESRPLLTDTRYNVEGRGAPLELCIDLCNRMGADLWLNIPHMADDDYVRLTAWLVRTSLNKELAVYTEYSNEVWNTSFSIGKATAWCKVKGETDPDCDGLTSAVKARQFYAKRSEQIGTVFREVFGQAHRIRPVLAGQAAYPEQLDWSLDWLKRKVGPVAESFYGVAIAPYWGASDYIKHQPDGPLYAEYCFDQGYTFADPVKTDGRITGWTNRRTEPGVYLADRAVAFLRSEKARRFFLDQAEANGLEALGYEGGSGMTLPTGDGLPKAEEAAVQVRGDAVMWAVMADLRMEQYAGDHLREWWDQGGDVLCKFVAIGDWDRDSSYGAVPSIGETDTPTLRAIAGFNAYRLHPQAEPPPDSKDVEIERLTGKLAEVRALALELADAAK